MLFKIVLILCHIAVALGRPNVIIILADDLGYGDLGWAPFNSDVTKNIEAPSLKSMAKNGMILSNFHTASPLCSPSRASIMVGLFPWRFGVDFIYAGDLKKDGSEEMDHEQLPLIPNIAMSFRDAGYYTAHIGGQSHTDIPNRKVGHCFVPGINQYGFEEYVGMSEGTNSDRYWTHQRRDTYHTGSKHLVRNDVPLPARDKPEILTDRQTEEAMRVIKEQTAAGRPFFLNLWYDAPHSPWEGIEPFYSKYKTKFNTPLLEKYASMVTSMDWNIGKLLALLDELKIAENTLVIFTSDNGPENEAGSPGPFKGRKRLLSEGGIRVPAIVQWKGKIAPGSTNDLFMLTTDLYPTLTEAAGIAMPPHNRIDGVSLLPRLLSPSAYKSVAPEKQWPGLQQGDERTVLWYTHSIGFPKLGAAWSHGFKVLWNDYEGRLAKNMPAPLRMFDMRKDPKEDTNLLEGIRTADLCAAYTGKSSGAELTWMEVLRHSGSKSPTSDEYAAAALHLFNHLLLKMHLFRHEGEVDWSRYHLNKPYETAPHCGIRNASGVDAFPLSNSLVPAPEFCGAAVMEEQQDVSCRCTPQNCNNMWTSGAVRPAYKFRAPKWMYYYKDGQPLYKGLSYLAPEAGTLQTYAKSLLEKWTEFSPVCAGDALVDARDTEGRSSYASVSPLAADKHFSSSYSHQIVQGGIVGSNKTQLAFQDLPHVGWARGGVETEWNWARADHQRVVVNRPAPTSCGFDMPLLTLAIHGMVPTYLSLCPESMSLFSALNKHVKFTTPSGRSYMDDNVFMVAVNLLMLHEESPFNFIAKDEPDETSESDTKPPPVLKTVKNVGVLDPLFFHSIAMDSVHPWEHLSSTTSDLRINDAALAAGMVWSYVAPFERRLRSGLSPKQDPLEYLVVPLYTHGVWSVAVLVVLEQEAPSVIYYSPLGTSDKPTVLSNAARDLLTAVMKRIRPGKVTAPLPVHVLTAPEGVAASDATLVDNNSGIKVLLFLKTLKELLKHHSPDFAFLSTQLGKNINSHYVETERKALSQYLVQQSKRQYARRRKYLRSMSSRKFDKDGKVINGGGGGGGGGFKQPKGK